MVVPTSPVLPALSVVPGVVTLLRAGVW